MSEVESYSEIKQGSDRNFGLVFGIVFLLIGLYPVISGSQIRTWFLVIGTGCILAGLFFPDTLRAANRIWFKLGLLLGSIVAPIVMSLVFFLAVTPTGLILRLCGKDILKQKLDPDVVSYWITREDSGNSMRNQF